MTRAAELKSINCSSCGAGLNVLGGGRVTRHICSYCGAALDANDDYRTLKTFGELKRPASPFKLGDRGTLLGVEFTVIGTLGYEERWDGELWEWVEHQVFSETHGYAWLTCENGHVTFSRRVRTDEWISVHQVETMDYRPEAQVSDEHYIYYETTNATISFAEGEFTWQPEIGQGSTAVSALGNDSMLSFEDSPDEREVYLTTYVPPKEVAESFGIDLPPIRSRHPLQPVKTWAHQKFVGAVSAVFAGLCLLVAVAMSVDSGETVGSGTFDISRDLPAAATFDVTDGSGLLELELISDVADGWAGISIALTDPDGNPRLEVGRASEYYSGYDSDGSWTQNDRRGVIRFRPEGKTGRYTLELDVEEAGYWTQSEERTLVRTEFPSVIRNITVTVSQGQMSGRYAFLAMAGFLVVAFVTLIVPLFRRQSRWAGSDWDDEE